MEGDAIKARMVCRIYMSPTQICSLMLELQVTSWILDSWTLASTSVTIINIDKDYLIRFVSKVN
jgi:hypothetical protein